MKYRLFGNTGKHVSALGFGCMRFPRTTDDAIDEEITLQMLQEAIEGGVNYFDTAYGYHHGQSEIFLGKFFKNKPRDQFFIATKLPSWLVEKKDDFDRLFEEQMEKLQVSYLDVYLLHGLNKERFIHLRNLGVLEWLDSLLSKGYIRFAGFSFHDSYEAFCFIVDSYPAWSMCQIQLNYMNENYQAGIKGLDYASKRGLAVVVMEPLLGGKLATPPPPIQAIWNHADTPRSPVEWALLWLWNKPEVSIVLSGMSTIKQVQENIASANRSQIGILSKQEEDLISSVRDMYNSYAPVNCTGCEYCLPCPNGVAIPRNFAILNSTIMYGNLNEARKHYLWRRADENEAIYGSFCVGCQDCEQKCPQHIPISQWMPYLHAVLGDGKPYDPSIPKNFTR